MNELKELLRRCNEMDITEQLNVFDNANIQHEAQQEYSDIIMALRHAKYRDHEHTPQHCYKCKLIDTILNVTA